MTTPATNSPIIVTDLWKQHGMHSVLRGCDLSLTPGSVTGLLGRNGAGKTTLLRCLLGLAKADRGTIRVLGDDAWDLTAASKARIGYVPQTPAPYAWMRLNDLLAYVGSFYPTWDQDLALRLLKQWDLRPQAHAGSLSPGETQRLALLLALAHRPDLLVLDEPAASLDPLGRRQFLATVLEAAGNGVTVLVSTHLCTDLERVANRIAVLSDGRITTHADIDELKEQVQRLRITSPRPLAAELHISDQLSRRNVPGGAVVVVRSGGIETKAALERDLGATVTIDALGLEDIAVELLQ
jgi:ABC-2 type transport system ATP-binding protein